MNQLNVTSQWRPVQGDDLETLLKERDPKYRHKILHRNETREICRALHELRHQQAIVEIMPNPRQEDQKQLQELIYDLENYILDHNWLYLGKIARGIKQRYLDLAKGLEFESLVRAGAMGLLKATHSFDTSRDYTLLTFATKHIWGQMIEELRRHVINKEFINFKPAEKLLAKVEQKFKAEHKTNSVDDEVLATELGLHHQDIIIFREELTRQSVQPKSLNAPMSEDGSNLSEIVAGDSQNFEICSDDFKEALKLLGEREKKIIAWRYGLALEPYNKLGHQLTQEEVGKLLKITRERVRQIESKALETLANILNIYQNKYYWIPDEVSRNGLIYLFDHLFEHKQKIFDDFDEFTEALLSRLKQERVLHRDKETKVLTDIEYQTLRALLGFEGPEMMAPKIIGEASNRKEAIVKNCAIKAIHKIYAFFKYMTGSELNAFFRGEISTKEQHHYNREQVIRALYDYIKPVEEQNETESQENDKS